MTKTSSASSSSWSTGFRKSRMFCNNIGRCNLNRIYGPMVSVSLILILWILIQWPLPLGLVLAQRSDIPYLSASQYELLLNQYKNQQQHQQYQPNPNSLECDQIFISSSLNSTFGSRNGTFIGPSFNIPMPATTVSTLIGSNQSLAPTTTTVAPAETSDETVNRYTRQCIYTFIAGPNERVRLSFTKFSLRAESPECLDEYLDIYAELRTPDTDLLSTPFGGRYCDLVIPHDRVSLFQTIVISFYTAKLTDGSQINGTEIFEGTYEFINATPYNVGTPMPNELCSFTIYSEVKREGEFMTPTYPGVYPKNITCYYLFKGVKGQRIKIEFMDFDLYYGGAHCPYDYVKIYDGESTRSPLINIYCGQQRQLLVYSSGVNLLVQFTTLKRVSAVNQNRGFSGYYEFSEKFVNLGFILNNENSEHILGTECDQKIYSRKESNGTVYAPNYPFLYHPNIMCKYFLYGLQDAQNLERINFHFEMLQIPTKDVNECTDAYVRLYTQLLAMEEFDFVFCGETIPPPVQSDGPLLLVVFNSGSTQGQGFKAHYWFETDYKIMGTQAAPGQCHFSYVSSGGQSGEFNSPRHPSNYPSNTYCVYEFFGEPDEQVLVVFNQFKFSDSEVLSLGIAGYDDKCTHDWIEIYTVHSNGREQYYGRYCGLTAPGPIITEHGVNQIKVIMNTDDNEVSSGFHANYQFDRASDRIQDCGGNFTNLENGIIQTPNYPGSYPATMQVCNWFITVRSGFRVLLYFDQFSIEGDPPNRGCPGAVVRVWINLNQNPIDLCGEKLNDDQKQFLSEFNVLRITFLTADKAVGAQGFRAIWTEIEMPPEPNDPRKNASFGACLVPAAVMAYPTPSLILDDDEDFQQKIGPASASALASSTNANRQSSKPYQCQKNGYCISSKLYCNGIQNCGHDDQSDESGCIHEVKINLVELVGGFTGLLLFTFFIIGLIGLILILIFNWYNRRSNDEKNVNQIIDKTCQHYMSHGGGMEDGPTQDYSAYYQSEPLNVGTPHRLIDVMTVSSSSTTPGGTGNIQSTIKNVRWPSASNSGDSSHHLAVANNDTQNDVPQSALFLDNGIGMASDNSPIPPPPPPPINRSMLTLRQSSLVNFHYGTTSTAPTTNDHVVSNSTFKDPNSTTRSMIGIDRNFTLGRLPLMPQQQQQQQQQQFAAYHQSNSNTSNMIGGNQTRTMSRQSENSRTSTFTTYPYCTLNNNHHHHANNSNNTMRIASPSPLTQYVHAPQSSHHKTNVEPIVDSMDSGQLITTTNNTTMVDVDEDILMDMDNSEQQHPRQMHSNTSNHLHHHTNNKADNGDYSMMMDHEDRFRNNNNNNNGINGNNNNNNSISSNNNINNNENNGIMTNEDECDDSMILDCSIQETQPQQQQQQQPQQQPSINNTNNNNYNSTMSSLRKYQMTRITTNQPQSQPQQPPSSPQPQAPSSSWQHHLHHSDQTSSTGNYLDSGIHGSAAAAAAHHHHHHRHHPHSSSTLILDE